MYGACMGLHHAISFGVVTGFLTVGDVSLTLLPALGTLFLLLGCLIQLLCEDFGLVVLYFVLPCLDVLSWRFALF